MHSHPRSRPQPLSMQLAITLALLGGAGTVTMQTAIAQTPSDEAAVGSLEEVIVTAEKRSASEQKTPISMTVFSQEALQSNGVGSLDDLTSIAPSVSFGRASNASIVTIRGVSSRDTTEIGDPAVAVSIDGAYFQRAIGMSDATFDLERVEVLRGPQGTLYGRNATGGAINFITAKPTQEFGGYASVTLGNYDLVSTEAALNLPLADRAQLRASFFTRSHDGYRNNAPGSNGDDADSKAARVHLMLEPTDQLTALLTLEWVKLGGVGPAVYGTPLTFDEGGNVLHTRQPLPPNAETWPLSSPPNRLDSTTKSLRWKIDYDFGGADLTYIGSYRRLDYQALYDLDGTDLVGAYFLPKEQPRTWSHEVRLASKDDTRFAWQIGGISFEEKNNLYTLFQTYDVANPPQTLYIFSYPDIAAKSVAGFGQASYAVTDEVKIEAGLRYSKDDKHRRGLFDYGPGVQIQDAASSSNKTTYHAGINWQRTPSNLLYAKYDTGYKAGGFTDVAPYDPETITAYEIGTKNRFLGNTVQLNAAAFYYDYTDQQISQFIDGRTLVRNAGSSEIYGLELEGSALLGNADRLDGYIGYLHAEFTDFALSVGSQNVQLAGNHPPQSPSLTANLGYQHEFAMPNGATLTARIQTNYTSKSYLTFFNYPNDRQDSYTRSDLIFTYTPEGGQWLIEAFGRNLENEQVLTQAQENGLWGMYNYQFMAPRTYGVRFKVNW